MLDKLGITWQGMLFHIVNLLILVVALTCLLYNPVKRIIAGHRQKLKEVFDENEKLNSDALETKQKYEVLMTDLKQEVIRINEDATVKAKQKSDEIIAGAESQAAVILESAKKEIITEKKRLKTDFETQVREMSINIAEKVLEREISAKDNKSIIDACLKEWDE